MRIQFSLKTFLIAVAVMCGALGLGWQAYLRTCYEVDRQQKAQAKYDHSLWHDGRSASPPAPPFWVRQARAWIHPHAYTKAKTLLLTWDWPRLREDLSDLKQLYQLNVVFGEIDSLTLTEAKELAAIPDLHEVCIGVTGEIEPGALAELAKAPRLEQFWVASPKTDQATIEAIAKSRSIKSVCIGGEAISPSQMVLLAKCQKIEELLFEKIMVNAETIEPLKALPRLKELHFTNCRFSPDGIETLATMPLTSILIAGKDAPLDASITPFAHSTTLERLIVHVEMAINPGELAGFENCPKLKTLILRHRRIEQEELTTLRLSPTLEMAAFTGELPTEAMQDFMQSKPGRTLTIYPEKSTPPEIDTKRFGKESESSDRTIE